MHKISKKRLVKALIFVMASLIIFKVVAQLASPCPVPWEEGSVYLEKNEIGIEIIDRYATTDGYYIFLPKGDQHHQSVKHVVGFVHGYGALNPKIFGAWIKHLVNNGHIVIYPRYQYNLLMPSSEEFTDNTGKALADAIDLLKSGDRIGPEYSLTLAGHSFGGVICANLLIDHNLYGLKKPAGVLIAEGGTGPLTGAMKSDYSAAPVDVPIIIVVGEKDYTVGDFFGEKVFNEVRSDCAVLLRQFPYQNDSLEIGASHYEPYAMDSWCDNHMDNITSRRAEHVAKTDLLDHSGYWKWLDALIGAGDDPSQKLYSEGIYELGEDELSQVIKVAFRTTP